MTRGLTDEVVSDQAEIDKIRSQIDVARARVDGAQSLKEAIGDAKALDKDMAHRIDAEISAAEAVVRGLELDAKARGVPLTLSGNRYRIYVT